MGDVEEIRASWRAHQKKWHVRLVWLFVGLVVKILDVIER